MLLSADWASSEFQESVVEAKSSLEIMLDDIIRRNGKYMVDMVLPSDTKGHAYIAGSVFTTKVKESHLYASINNHTVTVFKNGDIQIQGKNVPKHEAKLLRDSVTNVVSRHRCMKWLENYNAKEQMLTLMNGAQVTMPRFNHKRTIRMIMESRGFFAHEEMHLLFYANNYLKNRAFSPAVYF